jgi:hypothetical protein
MGHCEREEMPAGGSKGRQRGNEATCQLISSFKQINNGSEIRAPSERPKLSFRNQNYFTIHGPAVDIGRTPALRYGYDNLETMAGSQHASAKTPLPNLAAVAMPSGGRAIEVRQFLHPAAAAAAANAAGGPKIFLLSRQNNSSSLAVSAVSEEQRDPPLRRQASYLRLARGRAEVITWLLRPCSKWPMMIVCAMDS